MDNHYLKRITIAFAIGIPLIAICFMFVDKSVTDFAFSHDMRRFTWLKWLTYIAPLTVIISFLSIIIAVFKKCAKKPISKSHQALFLGGCNTLITAQFCTVLKHIFGRTWPATWINNNPSWINNHVYGFHFLHGGEGYMSFPSGHTTAVLAMVTVLWFGIPKLRWLYILAGIGVAVGLLGMYYHFLSDVLAGALLAFTTGTLVSRAFLSNQEN